MCLVQSPNACIYHLPTETADKYLVKEALETGSCVTQEHGLCGHAIILCINFPDGGIYPSQSCWERFRFAAELMYKQYRET